MLKKKASRIAIIAFLRSVCFVHHHDDIVSVVEGMGDFLKLENSRDQYFPNITLYRGNKATLAYMML